jgi:hypothetical protein
MHSDIITWSLEVHCGVGSRLVIAVHRRQLWCMRFYSIVHFILSRSSSSPARRSSGWRSNVLERVLQLVVLAHVVLSPPLGCDVLHHHLAHVSLHEPTDEPGIPELGGDSQVFAAAHERVGLAALGRGRDAVGIEVLLFATGEGDEAAVNKSASSSTASIRRLSLPSTTNKTIFPCHQLARHNSLSSRCKTPASRPERLVQYAPVLDLGQVEDSIGLDLDVVGVQLGLEDGALLGGEGRAGEAVVRSGPIDLSLVFV